MLGVLQTVRRRRSVVAVVVASVIASVALPWFAPTAEAATTIVVTTPSDMVNASDGLTSMREAISQANATVGDVVVQFASSFNTVTLLCDGAGDEHLNVSGDLDYTGAGPLSIQNPTPVFLEITRNCMVNDDRLLDIRSGASVSVVNVDFEGGRAGANGGAIRSNGVVSVTDATIDNNQATGRGGAIAALAVVLTNTIIADNVAAGDGGGVWTLGGQTLVSTTIRNNAGSNGGGVSAGGPVNANGVTVHNNTAAGDGGGIAVAAKTDLVNSTITANTAGAGRSGGGLYVTGGASPSTLTSATITGNGASTGANVATTVAAQVRSSAIGSVLAGGGPSCAGSVSSLGFNADEGSSCGFTQPTDRNGSPLLLGPLSPNGGSTWTMRPLASSPLIDIEPVPCGSASGGIDQRDGARPQGAGCDAGAYETNAPFVVTTTADVVNAGDGVLSLREAVSLTDTIAGHDIIEVAPGATYPITLCGVESNNVSGSLDARDLGGLTIKGSSSVVDSTCGPNPDAIFFATGATFTLEGVSVHHAPGFGVGYGFPGFGGVVTVKDAQILNSGIDGIALGSNNIALVLRNVSIKDSGGQGISSGGMTDLDMADSEITGSRNLVYPSWLAGAGEVRNAVITNSNVHHNPGGGFWFGGELTATNSHFDDNSGGIPGVLANGIVATDSTFDRNVATKVNGGGMFIAGPATLTRVSISGNSAIIDGGAGFTGTTTIVDSHIDNNTMTGPASSVGGWQGNAAAIFFKPTIASSTLSITGSTINGNGGPIWSAIYATGAVTLVDTTIAGNTAWRLPDNFAHIGATVYAQNAALTVIGSTISDNTVPNQFGNPTGGLMVVGAPIDMRRSTVTGNDGFFGGVAATGGGTIVDSTIVGNTGAAGFSNLGVDGTAPLTLTRTVVANPLGAGTNCYLFSIPIISGGYNYDSGTGCGFGAGPGDMEGWGDPQLGPLADNGGPTLTMLPGPTSALTNRVPAGGTGCTGAITDQRGAARPQGPGCDIGAVESSVGNLVWASTAASAGSQWGRSTKIDASGNSYVAGAITGTVTLGSGPSAVTLVTQGPKDGFLAKYAPDGSLLWAKRIGGMSSDEVWGIALDPAGNPTITGAFDGTVAFGPGVLLGGTNDAFVARYTPAGVVTWARSAGGAGDEQGLGLSIDPSGNVYVVGVYTSATATFGAGAGQFVTLVGAVDGFVARYGPGGGLWWVRPLAGTGQELITGVVARADGTAVVVGSFDGPITVGSGVGAPALNTAGGTDGLVARFNAAGSATWARALGGAGADAAIGVADSPTDVYVTGSFSGAVSAGPGVSATAVGLTDGFVARFSDAGAPVWIKGFGGAGHDRGVAIGVNGVDVYVTGSVTGAAGFGALSIVGAAGTDAFVARIRVDGAWRWTQRLASSAGNDAGLGVSASSTRVAATGSSAGNPVVIGQGATSQTFPGGGSDDLFVALFNR